MQSQILPDARYAGYRSNIGTVVTDVTEQALSVNNVTDGNQFTPNAQGEWQYNMKMGNYTSPCKYVVKMVSGDETEYVLLPTCVSTFVVD